MASSWRETPADNSTWVCRTGCLGGCTGSPHHHPASPHPPPPNTPKAPAGALAGPSIAVSVFPDTPRRLSDARRLIKGMICETPSFYSINQRHKAVKAHHLKIFQLFFSFFFFCCAPNRLSHIKGTTG